MPLVIPDEVLKQAQLTEREALVEFACRLFDAGRLSLPQATKMTGLSRTEMENELTRRDIPIYRPTVEDLRADVEAMKKMGL